LSCINYKLEGARL